MKTSKMQFNKITLSFPEKEERLFLEEYFLDSILQFRIAFLLVTFLYGIFGYLDSLMFPEFIRIFHAIRYIFVVPLLSVVFLLSFTKVFKKIWQELILISFIIGGTGIGVMIMFAPENFAYYGGMMLVFFAGYFFIKLRFFLASIAGWATLILFNIGAIFYSHIPSEMLINYNFFFISANIIGMFAAYNIEYYARRNFFLNLELINERLIVEEINKNLERVVVERTKELVLAKETAEINNANIKAIIEGTQNNIWAFNRNYEILYINQTFQKGFQRIFGTWLTPGVNLIKSLPEALRPIWKQRYDRVLNHEQFTIEDVTYIEDRTIYIQVSFNPIVKDGEIVGGSCFGNNITYRKLGEIELRKAKEKAEESESQLKELNSTKDRLFSIIAHDLTSPFNSILGYSDLLIENKNNFKTAQTEEFIQIINSSAKNTLVLLDNLLAWAKSQIGQIIFNSEKIELDATINEIIGTSNANAKIKNITLNYLQSDINEIYADKNMFMTIIRNLISNAIKFTNPSGKIEIYSIQKEDKIEISVSDNGIGMNEETRNKLFNLDTNVTTKGTANEKGSGLGLVLCKEFVEKHGEKIWVESTVGKGSNFRFTMPMN